MAVTCPNTSCSRVRQRNTSMLSGEPSYLCWARAVLTCLQLHRDETVCTTWRHCGGSMDRKTSSTFVIKYLTYTIQGYVHLVDFLHFPLWGLEHNTVIMAFQANSRQFLWRPPYIGVIYTGDAVSPPLFGMAAFVPTSSKLNVWKPSLLTSKWNTSIKVYFHMTKIRQAMISNFKHVLNSFWSL